MLEMKFNIGEICLTCNMIDPSENGLEAEITGIGIVGSGYYGGVQPKNASAGCLYEVHIPALVNPDAPEGNSARYGLFDIPEYRLKKLPPGDTLAEFDEDIWVPTDIETREPV